MKEGKDKRTVGHELVLEAVRLVRGRRVQAPKRRIWAHSGNYHSKLTKDEITCGVIAFLLFNKMESGSASDVDLYTLLQTYLLNREKRARINNVLAREG